MREKFFILMMITLSAISMKAQVVNNTSFESGEKLKFIASFYMSSLWTDIAEINMEVSEVKTSSQELYRLKCTASTFQKWDSFFKIRDLYESYVNKKSVKPYLFKRSVDEGGYKMNVKYIYKWKSNLVNASIQKRTHPAKKVSVEISKNTYDLVSVLYMIRNIDFSAKKVGDILKIPVLIDAKEEIITIKYKGIENKKVADIGNKKCYKLAISLKDEEILKGKGSNNVWLTADENMIPVLIKAEIPVGSVQIRLVSMSSLRN